jgi:hypothetical protein
MQDVEKAVESLTDTQDSNFEEVVRDLPNTYFDDLADPPGPSEEDFHDAVVTPPAGGGGGTAPMDVDPEPGPPEHQDVPEPELSLPQDVPVPEEPDGHDEFE